MEYDCYTVPEFCAAHRMGRTTFYALAKIGKAPRTIHLAQKVLVSREAAADWRREREAESANKKVSDAASSEAVAA
jgi:predicted DNA-binding transcriptional regulator AlpA